MSLKAVDIPPASIDRFAGVLNASDFAPLQGLVDRAQVTFGTRRIWNINSTEHGGGVAELLGSLVAYSRGAGVDARWLVASGDAEFFAVTKRLHNLLHGVGDPAALGPAAQAVYAAVSASNAEELRRMVSPEDVVILHDPQTAGLVEPMVTLGATVVWRCHVGVDHANGGVSAARAFLAPNVRRAHAYVFHRAAFGWEELDPARVALIRPSIDPFSPKNQELSSDQVAAILVESGLLEGFSGGNATFTGLDGSIGRIRRPAECLQEQRLHPGEQVVAQVSRWDALKDPLGVLEAFAAEIASVPEVHLVLAGPDVRGVADDPEGAGVLRACRERSQALPETIRRRVHLAVLPMHDAEENAAIVNALQRHATVVVQKSVAEGFGLTVAEAMWKARPVVAGRVGGIQEQIEHGRNGLLVDPHDLPEFGGAVRGLLDDPDRRVSLGEAARQRVRREFLGPRHLRDYVALLERLLRERDSGDEPALRRGGRAMPTVAHPADPGSPGSALSTDPTAGSSR